MTKVLRWQHIVTRAVFGLAGAAVSDRQARHGPLCPIQFPLVIWRTGSW